MRTPASEYMVHCMPLDRARLASDSKPFGNALVLILIAPFVELRVLSRDAQPQSIWKYW
jgi:hypothetical protein